MPDSLSPKTGLRNTTFSCHNIRLFDTDPASFDVTGNTTMCITGPSGCGKSLLLRAMADLLPHQGEAQLNGKPASEYSPEAWRQAVGFLPAESQWWFDTVVDHFPPDTHDAAMIMIKKLGLADDALHWQVRRCSTGEKQRLALARLLVRKPQVLLLDEPTANVDAKSMSKMEDLIRDYQQQTHCPIIWVSHDNEQIRRVADDVYHCESKRVGTA